MKNINWWRFGFFGITAMLAVMMWQLGSLRVRIAFAEGRINLFLKMADEAAERDPLATLEAIVRYYPSRTKQVPDSALDRIVERVREHSSVHLINELEKVYSTNFGTNLVLWKDFVRREATLVPNAVKGADPDEREP